MEEFRAIHGVSEELASGIPLHWSLDERREKGKKATIDPSDIYTAIRHYADDEQENFIVMVLNL